MANLIDQNEKYSTYSIFNSKFEVEKRYEVLDACKIYIFEYIFIFYIPSIFMFLPNKCNEMIYLNNI